MISNTQFLFAYPSIQLFYLFRGKTFATRDATGGGQRPKGGPILAFSDTFFGAEGAEKWELLEIFWEKLG